MKTGLSLAFAALALAFASQAWATTPIVPTKPMPPEEHKPRARAECDCGHGLRLSAALGGVFETYTGENKVTRDAGDAISGRHHFDFDVELALHFEPTTDSLLFGLLFDMTRDSWTKDPSFATISQLLVGLQSHYYFSHEIGSGPYAEGAVGVVGFVSQNGNTTGRTTQSTTTVSPLGVGARLGAGYTFKTSDWVSLFAGFNLSYRTAGASTAMPVVLQGGILF